MRYGALAGAASILLNGSPQGGPETIVDFIREEEVADLLNGFGISRVPDGEDCVLLAMDEARVAARACFYAEGGECPCDEDCTCTAVPPDRLASTIDASLHRLHQGQSVLLPVGKWRSVFDAVAFSLAGDEAWQEFESAATVELNTRDPLLLDSTDVHVLTSLLRALMDDGDQAQQGVFLVTAGAPVLMHLHPGGSIRFWFGDRVHADELAEVHVG